MQAVKTVIVVGAGPAGLMAAEVIRAAGHSVAVYDAKPSAGRKFLLAGIGGMNITHSEPYPAFIQRYYEKAPWLNPSIQAFDASALRDWIHGLGIETFVGTSGRVFPADMKAAPLLRNWLKRLRDAGVDFHMRHRLQGLQGGKLSFATEQGLKEVEADAVVLAMGGGSWPKLGSDGAWQNWLQEAGVTLNPLQSANCGFTSNWSGHLQQFAGSPLKPVGFSFETLQGETITRKGECILSEDGLEGSLVYAFSKHLRDTINARGSATLHIDLVPDKNAQQLLPLLRQKKDKESFSKYLKRSCGLSGAKAALLHECCNKAQLQQPESLLQCLKQLPVVLHGVKPIEEAISSAGGVCEESVDAHFMLKNLPGVFCAGEMLDWEAPTGGYLLTACFATGRAAGFGVCEYLQRV
ncbi:MAG: TIGR03862 family flavoprotein [Oceanospirillaceae bacterium]|nr:TIGR03862 family flavoprotein [Oceanospirillaceae bacterium]MCP5350962.1 TIGR03862 family flavoprotein [Oceanospirillaceae bacterium]